MHNYNLQQSMVAYAVLFLIGASMSLLSSYPSYSALQLKKAGEASPQRDLLVMFTLCLRNSFMLMLQLILV